jgi:predicted kinase
MKAIYILVGPPSVGKSTWIKNNFQNPYIISRDDLVEKVSIEYGLTYDDMFVTPDNTMVVGDKHTKYGNVIESPEDMKWSPLSYDKIVEANRRINWLLVKRMKESINYEVIIVDMTHMNRKSRKNSLKIVKNLDYKKVAVIFKFKGYEDLIKKVSIKRNNDLKKIGRSKNISDNVFDKMFNSYQDVSNDEGFDEIIEVDNSDILKKISESTILKRFGSFE